MLLSAVCALLLLLAAIVQGAWVKTFEDDFLGSSLNSSSWTIANYSSVKSEYDGHDAFFLADNVKVFNGSLVITTNYFPMTYEGIPYNMTSGWIDSQQKVNQTIPYGGARFEASMKMPVENATGSWPAWWLLPEGLPWPAGGEIDIIEWYGGGHYQHNDPKNPSSMASTYHYGYFPGNDLSSYNSDSRWYPNMSDYQYPIIDFSADFHTFGVELNTSAMRFYVDNVTTFVLSFPQLNVADPTFNLLGGYGKAPFMPFSSMYGIINVAVQPNTNVSWWKEGNNATTLTDWVRFYEWQD